MEEFAQRKLFIANLRLLAEIMSRAREVSRCQDVWV